MEREHFTGFPKEVIDFLWELRFNNHKEWFDANRERYKKLLKEPMDLLALDLSTILKEKAYHFAAIPSVSRINRDIRFSKNKAPYKDRKWLVLKPDIQKWQSKPAYFFELTPEGYSYGMGFYDPYPLYMQHFRKRVDANESEFQRLVEKYESQKEFVLEGGLYKKKFGEEKSPAVLNWYQRKSIALARPYQMDDSIFHREIIDKFYEGFLFLKPYYEFMIKVSEVLES